MVNKKSLQGFEWEGGTRLLSLYHICGGQSATYCKIMRIRQAIDDGELVAHLAPTTL